MLEIVTILLFALSMGIKGGWLAKWSKFPSWVDGSWLSALIISAFINPIVGLFWFIGNAPAMRDPAGPDWKLAVLRGVFTGACLTFATGNIWFILAGATMPIWYRLAIWQTRGQSWAWAEIYWGTVFGIASLF